MVVEPVDLNQIVTRLAMLMRPMLDDKFELRVRMGKGVGLVMADASALQQMLLNLCINARDAMRDGGKLVLFTCRCFLPQEVAGRFSDTKPGLYAMVSVSDTGCGMTDDAKAESLRAVLYDQGDWEGHGSRTRDGLWRGQGMRRNHRCQVVGGTRFHVYDLVARRGGTACPNTAIKSIHSRGNRRRKATVLYAEDDANVRRATTGGTVRTSRPCGDRWQ